MNAADILSELVCGRPGCECRSSAERGRGLTHCVIHKPDAHPSLSISEKGGAVLAHCQAGCKQSDVWSELRRIFPEAETAERKIVSTYDYVDEAGKLLSQVVRYLPKSFSQRKPNGAGDWLYSLNGVRRVLYNLPGVIAAAVAHQTIYIVEGEKDADALIAMGLTATTSIGGAGSWRDEYASFLRGAAVVVVQDKDEAGYKHAVDIVRSLTPVVASLRVVEAKAGKDVSDHLAEGWTTDDLLPASRFATPPLQQAPVLTWRTAREIALETPEQVDWVVTGYAARGAITDWSAKVKTGKTSLMLVMARSVAYGESFLGIETAQGPVVILTEERPPTFRSALGRWGLLDSDDLHVLYRREARGMEWPSIVAAAVEKCIAVRAILLVIDTFADWAQLGPDQENDAGAASIAMRPVQDAAEQGLAVLLSRHDRKMGGLIGETARGSSAIAGKADILVDIRRADSPGHERRRVLVAVGRFDDTPENLIVELDNNGTYVALGDALDIERAEAKDRILDIIPTTPPGFTLEDVCEHSPGMARSTLNRALQDLLADGSLFAAKGAGKSGRAKGFWRAQHENIPHPLPPRRGEGGMFGVPSRDGMYEYSTPLTRGIFSEICPQCGEVHSPDESCNVE